MKLSFYSPALAALLGFFLISSTPPLLGETVTVSKVKKIPFHGKLLSVDTRTRTITIAGKTPRVFHLTPTTRITDGSGNPSSLAAAIVGEDVGGSYFKEPTGAMTLFSVRFGAKTGSAASPTTSVVESTGPTPVPTVPPFQSTPTPSMGTTAATTTTVAAATPTAQPRKQTFSGKVVSVNAAANTLVVHGKTDHTFTLSPMTKVMDANGNASSLSNLVAGTRVNGTYLKSPDGTILMVHTLKIGK